MVNIQDEDVQIKFTLPEFLEHVETQVDVDDYDSVVENAWALRALANDREFVLQGYHDELKRHWQTDVAQVQSSQTIRLGMGPGFYVRSNIWLPIPEDEHAPFERQLYSYDLAHDHNFDSSRSALFAGLCRSLRYTCVSRKACRVASGFAPTLLFRSTFGCMLRP